MKYEYNGNLLEYDRVNKVATDILSKYPFISSNEAKDIAMLEGAITEKKSLEMELSRLYNILFTISYDKEKVKYIYNDYVNLLNQANEKNNDKVNYYFNIALEILNFLNDERDFPCLDEF